MIGQCQEQVRVSRLNQVAEELLRALVKANNDSGVNGHREAELLLSEFMRLMGYQL